MFMIVTWEVSEMNQYVTGAVIKELREKNCMTQAEETDDKQVSYEDVEERRALEQMANKLFG